MRPRPPPRLEHCSLRRWSATGPRDAGPPTTERGWTCRPSPCGYLRGWPPPGRKLGQSQSIGARRRPLPLAHRRGGDGERAVACHKWSGPCQPRGFPRLAKLPASAATGPGRRHCREGQAEGPEELRQNTPIATANAAAPAGKQQGSAHAERGRFPGRSADRASNRGPARPGRRGDFSGPHHRRETRRSAPPARAGIGPGTPGCTCKKQACRSAKRRGVGLPPSSRLRAMSFSSAISPATKTTRSARSGGRCAQTACSIGTAKAMRGSKATTATKNKETRGTGITSGKGTSDCATCSGVNFRMCGAYPNRRAGKFARGLLPIAFSQAFSGRPVLCLHVSFAGWFGSGLRRLVRSASKGCS